MSDLNYYAAPPAAALPHRTGLTVWGVVLIVLGGFFCLSGVLALVAVPIMVAVGTPAAGGPAGPKVRLLVLLATNAVTAGILGGGLVWLGVGSCRGRRWVRPLIVAGAPLVMAFGLAALLNLSANVVRAIAGPPAAAPPAAGPVPPQVLLMVTSAVAVVTAAGLSVALPGALVWFYRRPSVGRTLAETDPVRRWTDGVPVPLLRWVVACGYSGGVMLLLAPGGTDVAFTRVLDGWPAAAALLVAGGLLVAAAVGSFRRSTVAWAVGVAVFAVAAASMLTFAVAGHPDEYSRERVRRMGLLAGGSGPGNAGPQVAAMGGPALWVGTGLVNAALAGYGLWVRGQWDRPANTDAAA